jgi:Putative transmembrane protein (PGPGW)
MKVTETLNAFRQSPVGRVVLLIVGWLFLMITPLIGVLPGPGGVVTFAIGLGLVLQNSAWARRRFVAIKKKWPKAGGWADWGLRRKSAKRRGEKAKGGGNLPN